MNDKEHEILLGLYNPYPDPSNPTGIMPEMKKDLQSIKECLRPLKKQVDKNKVSIIRIRTIGGTISGLFALAITGIRLWIGIKGHK